MVCVAVIAALAASAAAQAPTTAAPPPAGTWAVRADTTTTGGLAPLLNITGSFTVTSGGGAVTAFHGTTAGKLNSGCVRGVRLGLVGVPILHFKGQSQGGAPGTSDYYWAGGNGKVAPYAPVTLTFQGPGRHAKIHRGSAMFRIYFPGAIGLTTGADEWGNITYTNPVGGICNLQFTPSH